MADVSSEILNFATSAESVRRTRSELRCLDVPVEIEKIAVLSVRHDSLCCCGSCKLQMFDWPKVFDIVKFQDLIGSSPLPRQTFVISLEMIMLHMKLHRRLAHSFLNSSCQRRPKADIPQ